MTDAFMATRMKSFVNENDYARDNAQNVTAEPVAGTVAKVRPVPRKGGERARLEVAWEVAPPQKVEIIAVSGMNAASDVAPLASSESVASSSVQTSFHTIVPLSSEKFKAA